MEVARERAGGVLRDADDLVRLLAVARHRGRLVVVLSNPLPAPAPTTVATLPASALT